MGDYRTYCTTQGGMRVILEIPEENKENEQAEQEIKKILRAVLQDAVYKYSAEGSRI